MSYRLTRDSYRPSADIKSMRHTKLDVPNVEYYEWEESGRFYGMGFGGKRSKPDFHYWFRSAEARASHIKNHTKVQTRKAQGVIVRRTERTKPHTLEVGNILDSNWGYNQTNRDFYEVIKVKGKNTVVIRRVASKLDHATDYGHDYVVPDPGNYIGKPMLKRVSADNRIRIASYASASPWSGKPVYETAVGWGH